MVDLSEFDGRIYYSHSMLKYNSEAERSELAEIRKKAPKGEIVNPNRGFIITCMEDCYKEIQKCDLVVFTSLGPFIGRGVYEELDFSSMLGIPIYYLSNNEFHIQVQVMIHDPEDWRIEYAKVKILTKEEAVSYGRSGPGGCSS